MICVSAQWATGQVMRGLGQMRESGQSSGSGEQQSGNTDSLIIPKKRPVIKITIHYRFLDDVLDRKLDSSINDFTHYLPLPAGYINLGNLGTPAMSQVFAPEMKPGFDAGFHAYDPYRLTVDSTRYFETTRPYTLLRYMIGGKQEQLIDIFQTQNPRKNMNVGFRFRKINDPGFFQNQNTDLNSINLFGHYNTKNKRYNVYLSFISNKMHSGENGGIASDASLKNPTYADRRTIPVNLGGSNPYSSGFFTSPVATKSDFLESSWLIRQNYDWGRGDTIKINDTTFNYEFHPSFRVSHTFRYSNQSAAFTDTLPGTANLYYFSHYGIDSLWLSKLQALTDWKTLSNDLSLVKFPSLKNQGHFVKAGATFISEKGQFLNNSIDFTNVMGHFEYHNLTRNEKWDLDARGELYLAGHNFGDYNATASLSRYFNEKLGDVTLSFTNVNQTPAFVYRFFQSSRFVSTNNDLKKTNLTRLQFRADNDHLQYHLSVNYYILTNYTYFKNFYQSAQYSTVFNYWQVLLQKQFTVGHFNWYLDLALQQASGGAPVHLPHIWTRDRFTYENTLFKNLILCTGVEGVYNTAYYADNYSPVLQQFVYQDDEKVSRTIPEAAVFLNFRIKAFVAYIRAENLNSMAETNQILVPHYPYAGVNIRVGFQWSFVD